MTVAMGFVADLESWWDDNGSNVIEAVAWTVGILVAATLISMLLRRAITRTVDRLAATGDHKRRPLTGGRPATVDPAAALAGERRLQRTQALGSVLRSSVTIVVFTIATFMILGQLGLALGPVLASAGIVGVALGFGAQNLVKDFLAGIFVVIEDQYGVGDVIDAGVASGTVEEVHLRITRLRDANGVIWYVRNGEVVRIGNKTQGWAVANVDVEVAYDEDIAKVTAIIERVGGDLAADDRWKDKLVEPPQVLGVESLAGDAVTIRVMIKTAPLVQLDAARELRARLKEAFDDEGIRVPVRPAGLPGRPGVVAEGGQPGVT